MKYERATAVLTVNVRCVYVNEGSNAPLLCCSTYRESHSTPSEHLVASSNICSADRNLIVAEGIRRGPTAPVGPLVDTR
jgi:hypothetical protein